MPRGAYSPLIYRTTLIRTYYNIPRVPSQSISVLESECSSYNFLSRLTCTRKLVPYVHECIEQAYLSGDVCGPLVFSWFDFRLQIARSC